MCGIVGFASRSGVANRAQVEAQRDALVHRGPDDHGSWLASDCTAALGHRRLSIIDLSPAGRQPMVDATGELEIVFNGEIYNFRDLKSDLEQLGHRFRTKTDTEVLLAAYREWGDDFLRRLNGQFAIGLYDAARRRLLLARDRAGEKPLFYRQADESLSFASELKALMADPGMPRVIEPSALNWYLAYGYVPGDLCILRGVHKLPAAHALSYDVDTDAVRVWRYWSLPDPARDEPAQTEREWTEELESLLEDSVRRQLVADVPVGILLSGGIDSSLVTALAARVSPTRVKTFTIAFPGHGSYDEAPFARLVAEHFGTEHTELVAEPATADLLPMLARQYDEPMADSSMLPTYLVSRLIREHATVALGGDGGDELFGGYNHHSWIQHQERLRGLIPRPVRRLAHHVVHDLVPTGVKGRNFVLGYTSDLGESIARYGLFFDRRSRQRLLAPVGSTVADDTPEMVKSSAFADRSPLWRSTAVDFSSYMTDDILVKVDRASMLTSLEVRAPWLDYRIIEFAFGRVPDRLRATATERKILPRRLAARLLPPALDLNRKQGFSIPLQRWFKGPWGRMFESVLAEADPALFDRRAIEQLIAAQRKGLANTNRLFALTLFELWRREYAVTL